MTLENVNTTLIIPPELDKKLTQTTNGLLPGYKRRLVNIAAFNVGNATAICDYIAALQVEIRPSDHYRRDIIDVLAMLAKRAGTSSFKDLTRDDVISFLQSFAKTDEDPLHKWKGTYELFRMQLSRFFKWLYNPHLGPTARPKPAVMNNIPKLKRKEISIYNQM